ncbi:hypothetical protein B0H17DRAFT_1194084 [Mycena rosella]|uniref:Uncharacterized protein n=1 Tax=Mycena rosella TaxID=1033263 RepID=A0AAD7GNZ2_MYCRO|nr:hypothetical protein B0H17DRAFT_1194084 [Mycena rosella]
MHQLAYKYPYIYCLDAQCTRTPGPVPIARPPSEDAWWAADDSTPHTRSRARLLLADTLIHDIRDSTLRSPRVRMHAVLHRGSLLITASDAATLRLVAPTTVLPLPPVSVPVPIANLLSSCCTPPPPCHTVCVVGYGTYEELYPVYCTRSTVHRYQGPAPHPLCWRACAKI